MSKTPLLITVPHAGESIPPEVPWLHGLEEAHLMRDVDRFVDRFYEPASVDLELPFLKTPWHRYVVDLNRFPTDFDAQSVEGASEPKGTHPKGLHWSVTTHGELLIPRPMSPELHQSLVKNYYQPFHDEVMRRRQALRVEGFANVYHLDGHSMPSVGTQFHVDPGLARPEVVISDYKGTTCSKAFCDLVLEAYQRAGFQVGYNFPYVGGGVTRMYGAPDQGFHNIQVELNRSLYMDEVTKREIPEKMVVVAEKIHQALQWIVRGLEQGAH